jgi:hypothetical protein
MMVGNGVTARPPGEFGPAMLPAPFEDLIAHHETQAARLCEVDRLTS